MCGSDNAKRRVGDRAFRGVRVCVCVSDGENDLLPLWMTFAGVSSINVMFENALCASVNSKDGRSTGRGWWWWSSSSRW